MTSDTIDKTIRLLRALRDEMQYLDGDHHDGLDEGCTRCVLLRRMISLEEELIENNGIDLEEFQV